MRWAGLGLRYRSSRWVAAPALIGAVGLGGLCALRPLLAVGIVLLVALVVCVWARPALAAYLLIALTPVTAGINRGSALPVVRPNEALALVLGATLATRGVVRLRTGQMPKLRLDRLELSLLLMAVTSSLVPLLWMAVRQESITQDDLLYALVLWKYLGLYVIIRASVSTDRQVRRCLWLAVTAGCVVALLAILQSLGLFGVPRVLASYYAPFGYTDAFQARGSSTLGLPAATADLAIINLAVVSSLWWRYRRYRPVLAAAAALRDPGRRVCIAPGDRPSAERFPVGVGTACQLDGATAEPADLFLAQAVLQLEFPAGRPALGACHGRDSGDGLCVDRERLHVAAVGRRNPAARQLPVPRVRLGAQGLAGGSRR